MRLALLGFVLRRVTRSLAQLLWSHVLTAFTLAVALFVFGAFMLVQLNLQRLLDVWGGEVQLTAYLASGLSADEVASLLERVQGLPEVELVRHTGADQAWRDFQAALGAQSGLLDGLPRDVLPASLEIILKPAHRDGPAVEQLAARLRQERQITSVEYPREWVERLGLIVLGVQWTKWTLGAVLFLAMFFVIGNMVKMALWARRDEVEILELVGASEAVIQAPFLVEGVVQGLAGGALAVAALWGVFTLLSGDATLWASLVGSFGRARFFAMDEIALLLAMGAALGATASLVALRRLRKPWDSG